MRLAPSPFESFSDAVFLAKAFIEEANAAEAGNDRQSADHLGQMAMTVQVVCVGCLHLLHHKGFSPGGSCLLAFLLSTRAQQVRISASSATH